MSNVLAQLLVEKVDVTLQYSNTMEFLRDFLMGRFLPLLCLNEFIHAVAESHVDAPQVGLHFLNLKNSRDRFGAVDRWLLLAFDGDWNSTEPCDSRHQLWNTCIAGGGHLSQLLRQRGGPVWSD
jgi:hypothetical protein